MLERYKRMPQWYRGEILTLAGCCEPFFLVDYTSEYAEVNDSWYKLSWTRQQA